MNTNQFLIVVPVEKKQAEARVGLVKAAMLRRDADEAGEVSRRRGSANIRKRCALPSTGSSGPLRKLRLKRGVARVAAGARRGAAGGASPSSSRRMSESSWNRHCHAGGARSSVSARKLVSALWPLNKEGEVARDAAARRSSAHRRCVSVEFSKRPRTKSKVLEADGERSWHGGHGQCFSDRLSNGSTMEVHSCASSTCSGERMAHLQDMYNSLVASKELVKVLANIWGPGELTPSAASLLSALRGELNLARAHARRLIKEQARRRDDAELQRRELAEEMRAWRSRQREKAAAAVHAELAGERRSRRRAEKVSAKLGMALAEAEASLRAAEREAERERRSRERLEEVCGELVRAGAGAGRGEVEEVRREAERAQEELDKEREMMQLADELREERVQMKLLEARLHFEEKNAVVERLRGELQAFLDTKKDEHQADDDHSHSLQLVPHAYEGASVGAVARAADSKSGAGEEDDDAYDGENGGGEIGAHDSEGSDIMHSIELNMDGDGKDYGWSCSYAAASKERRTASKSSEASRQHGSVLAPDRGTKLAGAVSSCRRSPEAGEEELEGDQWEDDDDDARSDRTRDLDEEAERYQAIKNLREQMLAGHGRFLFLSQDAVGEREHQHYGLVCQIEEGKL